MGILNDLGGDTIKTAYGDVRVEATFATLDEAIADERRDDAAVFAVATYRPDSVARLFRRLCLVIGNPDQLFLLSVTNEGIPLQPEAVEIRMIRVLAKTAVRGVRAIENTHPDFPNLGSDVATEPIPPAAPHRGVLEAMDLNTIHLRTDGGTIAIPRNDFRRFYLISPPT